MKSNRKALLALVGAIIAAIAVAYGAGLFDRASDDGVQSAALTGGETQGEDQAGAGGADADSVAQPDDSAARSDTAADAPAANEQAETVPVPGFDLLRVEPSGDMVIAGSAAPDSTIEIVSGADVLASVGTGPTGDFAAVLDERLKPGDYQIVLRATSPDGTVATSTGTAIVSVPETPDGEVLALVDEPGKASRLISGTGGTAAEQVTAQASAATDSQAGADTGAQPQAAASESEETAAEQAETVAEATAGDTAAPTDGEAATAEAPADDAQPADDEQTQIAAVAPETEAGSASTDAAGETDTATAPIEAEAQETQAGETEATQTPEPAASPTQSDIQVAIEAVEIEGPFVFVAGAAPPGQVVRVYANDILLGDARTSPQGRFLIEARRDLPQGDYVIRADVLAPNRSDVLARAAVPFRREPGENIAAVAAPSAAEDTPAADETAQAPAEDSPADEAGASDVAAAEQPTSGDGAVADTGAGAAQETAAAAADTASDSEGTTAAGEVAAATEQGGASADGDSAAAAAVPSQDQQPELPELQTALAETPPVITAAPLQPVDRSVIIRRGDTLWHISRRVYGRGIRYTTIYKANTDQIRDPDLIFPGQVFGVPERSEEGEAADMSQLRPEEE